MKFGNVPRPYFCPQTKVVQGLAVTPSEVAKLASKGIAVSSGNAGLSFVEGVTDPVLGIENMRGVDAADVWSASKDAQAKLVGAHRKDKDFYG